jgi:predicted dehydrogenase/nucleoside-diphosphate-sugar epimerase
MAHAHLAMIRGIPGAVVVGVADMNPQTLAETCDKFGITGRFSSLEDLVAAGKPQVLHIVTPTHTHRPLALAALEQGCHVYVEKPMGVNLGEVEEMLAAAERKKLLITVGHNFLFDPTMLAARAAIDRGEIGEICGIESYFGMDLGTNPKSRYFSEAYKHWAYHMPGSLQQNILDHPLALVVPFLGEPKSVHTLAVEGVLPRGIPGELRMMIGDGKRLASVTASFAASPRFHYVRYLGTHATLHVDLQNQRLQRYGHQEGVPHFVTRALMNLGESASILGNTVGTFGKVVARRFTPFDGVRNLAAAFYSAIEQGAPSPVSPEHARRVARLMDVAWEQIATQGFTLSPGKERAKLVAAQGAPAWKPRRAEVTRSVVTGASGFIGTRLVRALARRGDEEVRGFVRNEFRADAVRQAGAQVFEGDLRDEASVMRALEGADVVYHLGAAMGGTWNDFLEVTVRGTERLVRAAEKQGVKKLVFVSTIAVYGIPGQGPVTESTPYAERDLTPYVQSKIEAEKIVLRQVTESKLPATILRPGVVYAPGHRVSRIGYPLLGGRFYVIIGLNDIALPTVYVDELVDAMVLAGRSPASAGQTYNVVSPVPMTQTRYLKLLSEHGPNRVRYVFFPYTLAAGMGAVARELGKSVPILGKVGALLGSTYLRSCSTRLEYSSDKLVRELGWKPDPDLVAHFTTKGRYA